MVDQILHKKTKDWAKPTPLKTGGGVVLLLDDKYIIKYCWIIFVVGYFRIIFVVGYFRITFVVGFPIFWLWWYLMKIIPETYRVH